MALSQARKLAIANTFFGCLSFILGVFAELKKPAAGTAITGKGGIICTFPKDPSVALGALSFISVIISTVIGLLAIFLNYKGKSVPIKALLASITMKVFFCGAIILSLTGTATTFFMTITEGLAHSKNVHEDPDYACPTAKTGLFGGAAFLNLDACLFWLVCQMLVGNAREDYFDHDEEGEAKAEYVAIDNI